jgi:transcriptional regulator with XRE-family HTH domain
VVEFLLAKNLHKTINMKTDSISVLLGVTQRDLAVLLGVGLSRYSMFELGKRDLPKEAMQKIAKMLAYVQPVNAVSKDLAHSGRYQRKYLQAIKQMLRENEYQQAVLARKIAAAERKYVARKRRLKLAAFFSDSAASANTSNPAHIEVLRHATAGAAEENALTVLVEQELQLENLCAVHASLTLKLTKADN